MQGETIYSQKNIASMIAGRLTQSKGVLHELKPVPGGFKIVAQAATAASKAVQAVSKELKKPKVSAGPKVPQAPVVGSVGGKKGFLPILSHDGATVEAVFDLKALTNKYVTVVHYGAEMSFGRNTLDSWQVDEADQTVRIFMKAALAKKRGLI